jgi:hypothetical protein
MKIVLALLATTLLGTIPGWAVLGQYENSITLDQQHLRAQAREIARQGYSIQELKSPDGQLVREYVSPAGLVFGVAWQGPTMPDLRQLLGSYFGNVQKANQSRRPGRGPLIVQTKDFVFESGGHMRSFRGCAYVPSLFPKNIPAEVIR